MITKQITKHAETNRCLVEALHAIGYTEIEVHEDPQYLYDWQGKRTSYKANVIVRGKHVQAVGGSAWPHGDLGFVNSHDGYNLIKDRMEFDITKFNSAYAAVEAK